MDAGIKIEGLAEFQKALKELDPELNDQLNKALLDVAEGVAVDARKRIPAHSGRARASVMAATGADGPYIAGGGQNAPYFGWLDFGRRRPKRHRSRREGPWAHTGKGPIDGRYLFPAIEENRDEMIKAATAAFAAAWYISISGK